MPTYDFQCQDCDKQVEEFASREEVVLCPDCGKEMERLLSAPNFHLKGNCWAKDGYTKTTKQRVAPIDPKDNL